MAGLSRGLKPALDDTTLAQRTEEFAETERDLRPVGKGPLDVVFQTIARVLPKTLELRAGDDGSDSFQYCVMPRKNWLEVEAVAQDLVRHFFPPSAPA